MTDNGKFIDVNGLNMFYIDYGEGSPLILLHGALGTANVRWKKPIKLLSQHFRIIAPDSRGHGRTNNPTGKLSYKLMCEDIVALVHALSLKKPLICGYSDGAQIALEIGIRYPDLGKALVVVGAVSELSEGVIEGMKEFGVEGSGVVNFEYFEEKYPNWVSLLRKIHTSDQDYWKELLISISKMWFDPVVYPKDALKRIKIPTLIMLGDQDEVLGSPIEDNVKMFRSIPRSELAIIPNTGHNWTELFTEFTLEFLLRHS
ncbi:MAG: alpha/beta fold hydrolase [Candidatus Kariarchaeaceae archaeon]|jgi:pimeloyl-ACP methyl ester carboxylesterase